MLAKIEQLLQEIEGLQAANAEELEALRIKYLSKKGAINELMADFRNVPAEQKKEVGMKLNELKNKAQERIATLKEVFETQDNGAAEMDLTRTAYPIELGTRHPLSIVKNEIIDIFIIRFLPHFLSAIVIVFFFNVEIWHPFSWL